MLIDNIILLILLNHGPTLSSSRLPPFLRCRSIVAVWGFVGLPLAWLSGFDDGILLQLGRQLSGLRLAHTDPSAFAAGEGLMEGSNFVHGRNMPWCDESYSRRPHVELDFPPGADVGVIVLITHQGVPSFHDGPCETVSYQGIVIWQMTHSVPGL